MQPKMLNTVLIGFLSILFLPATAQKTEVKVTPPYKKPEYGQFIKTPNGFLGLEQTGVKAKMLFTMKLENITYGLTLSSFDDKMNKTKELKLEGGDNKFGPFQPSFREVNDKYYIIYFKFGKNPDNEFRCIAAEIDPATLTVKREEVILDVDVKDPRARAFDMITGMRLSFAESPDESRQAVLWYSGIRNEYYVGVLDKDLKHQWSKKVTASYAKQIETGSVAIDNAGIVYSVYRSSNQDDKVMKLVSTDQKRTNEKDITLAGGTPVRALVFPSTGSTPVQVVGTYKSGSDMLRGIFHQRFKSDLKITENAITEFSKELVDKLDKQNWANNKAKKFGLSPFEISAVRTRDDNIALTGEFRRVVQGERSSAVIAGNIIAAHIINGKAVISMLPKNRVSAGTSAGDSYLAVAEEGRMVIFYNDYPKNLEKSIDDDLSKTSMFNLCVLAAAVIENDGSIKRFPVLDMKKENFVMVVEQGGISAGTIQIPGQEYGSMGQLKKQAVMATITLK